MNESTRMLKPYYRFKTGEAGVDEAGRGCLAGPVFAAAVILPSGYTHPDLNDSKKLSDKKRRQLRSQIITDAIAWGIAQADPREIDKVNILQATYNAMHQAIRQLQPQPGLLLIDGNRFRPIDKIPHVCIIKGDSQYAAIAAASILAKTTRDDFMIALSDKYPQYGWHKNKGYATKDHILALLHHGPTRHHRKSFHLKKQYKLPF